MPPTQRCQKPTATLQHAHVSHCTRTNEQWVLHSQLTQLYPYLVPAGHSENTLRYVLTCFSLIPLASMYIKTPKKLVKSSILVCGNPTSPSLLVRLEAFACLPASSLPLVSSILNPLPARPHADSRSESASLLSLPLLSVCSDLAHLGQQRGFS